MNMLRHQNKLTHTFDSLPVDTQESVKEKLCLSLGRVEVNVGGKTLISSYSVEEVYNELYSRYVVTL